MFDKSVFFKNKMTKFLFSVIFHYEMHQKLIKNIALGTLHRKYFCLPTKSAILNFEYENFSLNGKRKKGHYFHLNLHGGKFYEFFSHSVQK